MAEEKEAQDQLQVDPLGVGSAEDITSASFYTIQEEIAHSITHGIGLALSIAGLTLLVTLAVLYGDIWQQISFIIYGGTLIFVYLSSTLYHSLPHPKIKQTFRILDHISIYLAIAGSYTPFCLIALQGPLGWVLFAVVWVLALLGSSIKLLFAHRHEVFANVSTVAYLLMGWIGILVFQELLIAVPLWGIIWLVSGALFYTVGVIFYAWESLPYNHAIWHLFVLSGSLCHYFAVFSLISIR